uniref:Uncharacterized protein n=1 Tax=Anguilla anguilla TaxID=7936 RepID=A0A0E9Q643_ANGAN
MRVILSVRSNERNHGLEQFYNCTNPSERQPHLPEPLH